METDVPFRQEAIVTRLNNESRSFIAHKQPRHYRSKLIPHWVGDQLAGGTDHGALDGGKRRPLPGPKPLRDEACVITEVKSRRYDRRCVPDVAKGVPVSDWKSLVSKLHARWDMPMLLTISAQQKGFEYGETVLAPSSADRKRNDPFSAINGHINTRP